MHSCDHNFLCDDHRNCRQHLKIRHNLSCESQFKWTDRSYFLWKKRKIMLSAITFTTVWSNSANDKLVIFFYFFPRKQDSICKANCLLWRQFAWNIKSRFLGKIRKIFKYVIYWKFYPECKALRVNDKILTNIWPY